MSLNFECCCLGCLSICFSLAKKKHRQLAKPISCSLAVNFRNQKYKKGSRDQMLSGHIVSRAHPKLDKLFLDNRKRFKSLPTCPEDVSVASRFLASEPLPKREKCNIANMTGKIMVKTLKYILKIGQQALAAETPDFTSIPLMKLFNRDLLGAKLLEIYWFSVVPMLWLNS